MAAVEMLWEQGDHEGVDVLMLQEPPLGMRTLTQFRGFDVWLPEGLVADMRCCTLCRQGLVFRKLPLDSPKVLGLQLDGVTSPLVFLNAYIASHTQVYGLFELQSGVELCLSNGWDFVISMDSNGQHPTWSGHLASGNTQGNKIHEFVQSNGLHVCNNANSPPTFVDTNGTGFHIDLTLSSVSRMVMNWTVHEQAVMLSDHNLLAFEVVVSWADLASGSVNEPAVYRNWDKTNWDLVRTKLLEQLEIQGWIDVDWDNIASSKHLHDLVEQFQLTCMSVVAEHVPQVKPNHAHKAYWTPELKQAKAEASRCRRREARYLKRHGIPAPPSWHLQTLAATQKLRDLIKKEKRKKWTDLIRSLDGTTCWKVLKSLTQPRRRLNLSEVTDLEGVTHTNDCDVHSALIQKFFPTCEEEALPEHQHIELQVNRWRSSCSMDPSPPVTVGELELCIRHSKTKSAPGMDGLTHGFFKNTLQVLLHILVMIYSACFRLQTYPVCWKRSLVVPIPKGDGSSLMVSQMRPISLLSVLGKYYDKLIEKRIRFWLERQNYFSRFQFGFRASKNCGQALELMQQNLSYKLGAHGGVNWGVFIDLFSAFDTAWPPYILHKLIEAKVPDYLIWAVDAFLTKREVFLRVQGRVFSSTPSGGCPQGSPLSPLLFIVLINDIFFLGLKSHLQAFADDLGMVTHQKPNQRIEEVKQIVEEDLSLLAGWLKKAKLVLNTSKTVLVRFGSKRRMGTSSSESLRIGHTCIQEVTHTKYLGVLFDQTLTFGQHVDYVIGKCHKRLLGIRRVAGIFWGPPMSVVKLLVSMSIETSLYYAVHIWGVTNTKTKMSKIDKMLRQAGLLVSGCLRTTSYEMVFCLSGILPFEFQSQEKIIRYFVQVCKAHDTQDYLQALEARAVSSSPMDKLLRAWGARLHQHGRLPHPSEASYPKQFLHTVANLLQDDYQQHVEGSGRLRTPSLTWTPQPPGCKLPTRLMSSLVSQCLAMHFPCRQYLCRFKITPTQDLCCACGDFAETREHILFHCTLYEQERSILSDELCGITWKKLVANPLELGCFLQAVRAKWRGTDRSWGPRGIT